MTTEETQGDGITWENPRRPFAHIDVEGVRIKMGLGLSA